MNHLQTSEVIHRKIIEVLLPKTTEDNLIQITVALLKTILILRHMGILKIFQGHHHIIMDLHRSITELVLNLFRLKLFHTVDQNEDKT